MDDEISTLAARVINFAREKGLLVATAESCTGGLVAAALTGIAGSSEVLDRGFVTYSNDAKSEMIGVPEGLISRWGAVSKEVASAMASGALAASQADVTVAVTGIAGPGGGSPDKPVGLIHFAVAAKTADAITITRRFGNRGREEVRRLSVAEALNLLLKCIEASSLRS